MRNLLQTVVRIDIQIMGVKAWTRSGIKQGTWASLKGVVEVNKIEYTKNHFQVHCMQFYKHLSCSNIAVVEHFSFVVAVQL